MNENDKAEFQIEISAADATEEELDRITRQLLSQLRELDVESAQLTKGGTAPSGSKGESMTIGSIVIEVLPAILPSVIGLIQAWVTRGRGRTVKFKGIGIDFEGSPEDLQKLLTILGNGKENERKIRPDYR
jgi:hypothetical protein